VLNATHYSKISNLPQFTACPLNQQSNTVNTGLLAYKFTKLGDNLTDNDEDILIANSNSKHAEWAKLASK